MDPRLKAGLRAVLVMALVLGGLMAGRLYAISTRAKSPCPPSASPPSAPAPPCAAATTLDRERLLTLVGGFGVAVVAVPATWPITRRRGERFWVD